MFDLGGIARYDVDGPSSGDFSRYSYNNIRWKEKAIHLSDDAKVECGIFKLDSYQLVDMLDDPTDCPKYKQFHKKDKKNKNVEFEICSKKNREIFRIIYCEDDCIDIREKCWLIIHVKPA